MVEGTSDALVLFGLTGDLAKKKLFPALYHMAKEGSVGPVPVIGVASSAWTLEQLCDRMHESIVDSLDGKPIDDKTFDELCKRLSYVSGDYREASTYDAIAAELED